jgi:hypothetical protein
MHWKSGASSWLPTRNIYYTSFHLPRTLDINVEDFDASVLVFEKIVDVHFFLNFFLKIKCDCGMLKHNLSKSVFFRHYVNETERGLACDWGEFPTISRKYLLRFTMLKLRCCAAAVSIFNRPIFVSPNIVSFTSYTLDGESYAITQRLLAKDDHFICDACRQLINVLFNRLRVVMLCLMVHVSQSLALNISRRQLGRGVPLMWGQLCQFEPRSPSKSLTYSVFIQMLIFTGHLYFSNKLFKSYFLYNNEDRNGGEAGISVVCSSEFWCKYFRFDAIV